MTGRDPPCCLAARRLFLRARILRGRIVLAAGALGAGLLLLLALGSGLAGRRSSGSLAAQATASVQQCSATASSLDGWCRAHGLVRRSKPGRVICFTLIDTELELLELRLRELRGVVDAVVVFESAHTSTGRRKDLYLQRVREYFATHYGDLVYHYTSEDLQINSWRGQLRIRGLPNERLSWARNEMFRRAKEQLALQAEDLVLLADADELQWREAVRLVKECEVATPVSLYGKHAEIGFDFTDRDWAASLLVTVGDVETYGGGQLDTARNNRHMYPPIAVELHRSSWHCSWCFASTYLHFRKAMSFTHADRYDERVHTPDHFCSDVRKRIAEERPLLAGRLPEQLRVPNGAPSPTDCWLAELEKRPREKRWPSEADHTWRMERNASWLRQARLYGLDATRAELPVPLLVTESTEELRARYAYLTHSASSVTCASALEDGQVSALLSRASARRETTL